MDPTAVHLEAFIRFLENHDRFGAAAYALSLLESGEATVAGLYEQVLAPSLNRIEVPREKEDGLIWREHMMSSIVRTVVEAALPFVRRERETSGGAQGGARVLLACPEEEYHELGIRMGADFFAILGYDVAYVGCNTPRDTLLDAAMALQPALVALGVTNYLNLAQLPPLAAALKALPFAPRVYISGSALKHTGRSAADFGADGALDSFASIRALGEGRP
ncbi:MAG TPA: cobalamin-dependent protein [Candidatus Limnocylindria bacterium]|nr:cobalamin-dependent protein [Candidatus Limnocylindria bacterium]